MMVDDVLARVAIPAVAVFCMAVVGLDLTLEAFRRVARHPPLVAVGVLGPILVLPPLAVALGHTLALPPAVAGGMVLVAACPTAIVANVYTALARGTVALSLTVTAVSSVGSVVTLPPVLALSLGRAVVNEAGVSVPVGRTMGQLFVLLFMPFSSAEPIPGFTRATTSPPVRIARRNAPTRGDRMGSGEHKPEGGRL